MKKPIHIHIDMIMREAYCDICGGKSRYRFLKGFKSRGRNFTDWDWLKGFIKEHKHNINLTIHLSK